MLPSVSALTLRLFGAFEAQVQGRPLGRLRTRKERWLLAVLTLRQSRRHRHPFHWAGFVAMGDGW